jgi:hypothetical protein
MHVLGLLLLLAHGDNAQVLPTATAGAPPRSTGGNGGPGPADWLPSSGGGPEAADPLAAEVSRRVARRGVLAPLSAAWNFRFGRNRAAVAATPAGQVSFAYGRGSDVPPLRQAAPEAATADAPAGLPPLRGATAGARVDRGRGAGCGRSGSRGAGCDDGSAARSSGVAEGAGWLRLAHFTWAKPWEPPGDRRDSELWSHERTALAARWRAYEEDLQPLPLLQAPPRGPAERGSGGSGDAHGDGRESSLGGGRACAPRGGEDAAGDEAAGAALAAASDETFPAAEPSAAEASAAHEAAAAAAAVNGSSGVRVRITFVDTFGVRLRDSSGTVGLRHQERLGDGSGLLRVDVEVEVADGPAADAARAAGPNRLRLCQAYRYHEPAAIAAAPAAATDAAADAGLPGRGVTAACKVASGLRGLVCTGLSDEDRRRLPPLRLDPWPQTEEAPWPTGDCTPPAATASAAAAADPAATSANSTATAPASAASQWGWAGVDKAPVLFEPSLVGTQGCARAATVHAWLELFAPADPAQDSDPADDSTTGESPTAREQENSLILADTHVVLCLE